MKKSASFYFFKRKPIVLKDRYECWREVADLLGLTARERLRVEWMVFYYTAGKENVALTAQHFGISRKTFYKCFKRFRDSKYDVHSLTNQSKAPCHKRKWEVTLIQGERIRRLRKRARARQKPKKRITQLVKEGRLCFLFQLDTIVIYWNSLRRYILTAVDHATKLGYARMYKNKSSRSQADFLYRHRYLVGQPIENLQTDNGSEFAWEFERASARLGIQRYFSRVKTQKDNLEIERFNQTLEYEWLYDSNLSLDTEELNPRLVVSQHSLLISTSHLARLDKCHWVTHQQQIVKQLLEVW